MHTYSLRYLLIAIAFALVPASGALFASKFWLSFDQYETPLPANEPKATQEVKDAPIPSKASPIETLPSSSIA